jgi:2-(1,2-epoxy-1,2-dihydrophenyl)acetyl-CoA isomerase
MADAVLLDVEDGIASIRVNRPDRLNVLSVEVSEGLRDAVESAVSDASVRVIVLSGEGRSFMAGGDLRHMAGASDRGRAARELIDPIHAALLRLSGSGQITIASVHGPVAGAGLSIAMGLDLAIAAESTVFHFAYSSVAASPDCGGTWALPRLVGYRRALQIALIDDGGIPANRALELGLVSRVVADDNLAVETRRLAERLRDGAPVAQAATKRLFRQALETSFAAQLDAEAEAFEACARTEDFDRALAAFFGGGRPSEKKGGKSDV